MVLTISVDGLNPVAIERLGPSATPNFHRLLRQGASTLNARTAYERTNTLPNHTGMLTGRGVSGGGGHGVTFNKDDGRTLTSVHGRYVAGMFDVAHDHGLTTAFFAEKTKFRLLTRSWDSQHGADDTTGEDNGRDKIDIDVTGPNSKVMDRLVELMKKQQADLIFLHLSAPDVAGHASGWLSEPYLAAVRSVDDDLGRILAVADRRPDLERRFTMLLTADHGGVEGSTGHSDTTLLADYRVPFIAWGNGVAEGVDLYALNEGRTDPGNTRPSYEGRQPVRNLDLANSALSVLALPPIARIPSSSWPQVQLH